MSSMQGGPGNVQGGFVQGGPGAPPDDEEPEEQASADAGAAVVSGTAGSAPRPLAAEGRAVSSGSADVTIEAAPVATSATLGYVVGRGPWSDTTGQVDAFLAAVGPIVRDALIDVFQEVLGPITDAPSDEERVRRLQMLWDLNLAERVAPVLEATTGLAPPVDAVLNDASAARAMPELEDKEQARNWVAFLFWLILTGLGGVWLGHWAAQPTIDGLGVLVPLVLACWDRYGKL
jgi:hypothetical protein